MAEIKKTGAGLSRQSFIYIGIGIFVILLLIFLGIMPLKNAQAGLDKQMAELRYRIEEQRILVPLYKSLTEREREDVRILPLPPRSSLPQAQINTIPKLIGNAARQSGLSLMSVSPKLAGVTGGTKTLPIHVSLRGDFFKFRKFLINMGAVPYIQHIEEISIQEVPGAREFMLKIFVAVA